MSSAVGTAYRWPNGKPLPELNTLECPINLLNDITTAFSIDWNYLFVDRKFWTFQHRIEMMHTLFNHWKWINKSEWYDFHKSIRWIEPPNFDSNECDLRLPINLLFWISCCYFGGGFWVFVMFHVTDNDEAEDRWGYDMTTGTAIVFRIPMELCRNSPNNFQTKF